MHQVLLIDEIVQDIFELCFEYADGGKEKLHDLCQVARCCKAWKDPALDRLWRRLPCVIPLLSLIPGLFQVDGVFVGAKICISFLICLTDYIYLLHLGSRPLWPGGPEYIPCLHSASQAHYAPRICPHPPRRFITPHLA
jgi:hypothetical protein